MPVSIEGGARGNTNTQRVVLPKGGPAVTLIVLKYSLPLAEVYVAFTAPAPSLPFDTRTNDAWTATIGSGQPIFPVIHLK